MQIKYKYKDFKFVLIKRDIDNKFEVYYDYKKGGNVFPSYRYKDINDAMEEIKYAVDTCPQILIKR